MSEPTEQPFEERVRQELDRQFKVSVQKNPDTIADAIFPLLGPIIRRSVSESLNGMLQSFNETLRYSVSIRGLFWRLEALRTGRTFSDVVLSKTMAFQVEQVFLIHNETGLMLHHVAASEGQQDPMMISGMLTAIQDFVQSSLGSSEGEALDTLNVGDTTIVIERGPHAFLAAVIRGTMPTGSKQIFAQALGNIHKTFGPELEHFSGDTEPLEPAKPMVEDCLISELKEGEKKFPIKLFIIWTVFITLLVRWTYVNVRDGIYWDNYIKSLNLERGIVVVTAKKEGGLFHVWGLRDSYAADPISILKKTKLGLEQVESRWEPYHSTLPEFVLQRKVDQQIIRFSKGTAKILGEDIYKLDEVALGILELAEHLSRGGKYPEIIVYGHTNTSDDKNAARELSQKRADVVLAELQKRGVVDLEIAAKGIMDQRPVRRYSKTEFDESYNRSVRFRIKVRQHQDIATE